jgi:hypothetical protein
MEDKRALKADIYMQYRKVYIVDFGKVINY